MNINVKKLLQSVGDFIRRLFKGELVVTRFHSSTSDVDITFICPAPLLIFAVVLIVELIWPSRAWVVMLSGLAVMMITGYGWALNSARRVSLFREMLYGWMQVGDLLEESLTLRNKSVFPVLAMEIEDLSNVPGYDISGVGSINYEGDHSWRKKAVSQRRGKFHLGPTISRITDPLGLFLVTCHYKGQREVLVLPPVLQELGFTLPSGGGQGRVSSRDRSFRETMAIGGVRDYVPGDPMRRIHWALSMRHQHLLIKEFDVERGTDIWLVPDLNREVQAGEGADSTLEYCVVWAASWAWYLIGQGKGVGLYTYGPERILIPPATGSDQLWTIMQVLAQVDCCSGRPVAAVLQELRPFIRRGHSLVVFTPSLSPDWPPMLSQAGAGTAAHAAVLLDPESFQEPDTEEVRRAESPIDAMLSQLARLGIAAHVVHRQEQFELRPTGERGGNWEMKTTPWGKVVVDSRPTKV